jgi:hypothetical protein
MAQHKDIRQAVITAGMQFMVPRNERNIMAIWVTVMGLFLEVD